MHIRKLAAGAIAVAAMTTMTGVAEAADGGGTTAAITATITAGTIGSRSITLATPIVMTSALDADTLSGSLAATVTEAARSGTNPWSVTADMTALTNATSDTIAKTNMTVSARSVLQTAGGGTSAAPTGGTAIGASPVTLFSNTGQLTSAVYTGTYVGSSTWTLAVPNASKVGVYSGTVTLTLNQ